MSIYLVVPKESEGKTKATIVECNIQSFILSYGDMTVIIGRI